ncbi:hypothetical protein N0V82_007761 [Gnomoniopsis sp. IMI 355080]|nr:hypothetical protein N0V82_007761 [Gnomoniopsis sp. IMI 355080]
MHLPHWSTGVLSQHDILSQPWREWGDGTGFNTGYTQGVGNATSDRIAQRPLMTLSPSRLVTPELSSIVISAKDLRPEYVVISYTWGRWRHPVRDNDTPFVGGYWKVPANQLFTREDLNKAIQKISAGSHSWVDVFCIPQDDDDPLKAEEIKKQSAIFRSAHNAAVWLGTGGEEALSEVCSWQPEVVYMVSASILDFPDIVTYKYLGWPAASHKETQRRLRIIAEFSERVPWASSLWTLQEAALRPDAIFYTKSGDPILHSDSGNPVTVKHLSNTIRAIRDELMDVMGYNYGQSVLDDPELCGLTEDDISLITRAIDEVNIVSLHNLGSMNAGELLLASKKRKAWDPLDRVYGIMGAIGVTMKVDYKGIDPDLVMNDFLVKLHNELPVEIQAFHRVNVYQPDVRRWLLDEDARLLTLLRQRKAPAVPAFSAVNTSNHLVADMVEYLLDNGRAELKGCLLSESAVLASDRCGFNHFAPVSSYVKDSLNYREPATLCLRLENISQKASLAVVSLGTVSGLEHRGWAMAYMLLAIPSTPERPSKAPIFPQQCIRLGVLVAATKLFFTSMLEGTFEIL